MSDRPETSGCTMQVLGSVADRAKKLGLNVPAGVCILPRGFFNADAAAQLVHESTAMDVKVILRKAGITLDNLTPNGVTIPFQAQHDANWLGPVIFIGAAAWSENPHVISVALSVIANYVTDFFKGRHSQPQMSLGIVIEQTDKKRNVQINYHGPVTGLKACEKTIRDAMK
jgi:hypothetical protein